MSIVIRPSVIDHPASRFSLVGLPTLASIPFSPVTVSRPSDFPADLLSISDAAARAAANDFILHCEDDHDEAADPAPSDSWPTYILPMGDRGIDRTPAARTDAHDPIDTDSFPASDTFDTFDCDYIPSVADEAFHTAYTLEALGIPASPPPEIAGDREAGLRWSRGKYAARAASAERNARIAREKEERAARALLKAYGHGQECGWAGGPRIAPHGCDAAQCERFLAGYDAGETLFLAERPSYLDADGCGSHDDESADYGGQIGRALAEDVADRLERAATGDWSFMG